SFDVVFSHAFLSSIPDIGYVQQEIARVLKPGGDLIAVLYARWSLHWLLSRLAQLAGSTQNAAREFVYDSRKVRRTFRSFHLNSASKMFLDYGLPGESLFGWWIWAHLQSRTPPASS
ncbi:MAG TPA: methyltransferase domain-containing protein, partial [Terriglobales bacterium]|nr:methyltransferase domain-containing protein [Terriglobales bacterium]